MPFHDAVYFVTTTLTTVGYGDVVVKSSVGGWAGACASTVFHSRITPASVSGGSGPQWEHAGLAFSCMAARRAGRPLPALAQAACMCAPSQAAWLCW